MNFCWRIKLFVDHWFGSGCTKSEPNEIERAYRRKGEKRCSKERKWTLVQERQQCSVGICNCEGTNVDEEVMGAERATWPLDGGREREKGGISNEINLEPLSSPTLYAPCSCQGKCWLVISSQPLLLPSQFDTGSPIALLMVHSSKMQREKTY